MEPTTSGGVSVSNSEPSGGGGGYQASTTPVDTALSSSDPLGLQSTGNNENLNPQFAAALGGGVGGPKLDISQLLAQVMSITSQDLKEAQDKKLELEKNRLRPALYQVLCELKEKTALNMRQTVDDDPQDPQIARLDNMLMAEGVSGPERSGDGSGGAGGMPLSPGAGPGSAAASSGGDSMALEHSDYKQKLSHIREVYWIFSLISQL